MKNCISQESQNASAFLDSVLKYMENLGTDTGLGTGGTGGPPGPPNQRVCLTRGDSCPPGPPGPGPQNQLIFGTVFRPIWEPQNEPQMLENRAREAPKTLL